MQGYRLLVNSLPKSGSNLLQRCVEVLGYIYSRKSLSSANILGNFYFLRSLIRGGLLDKNQVIVGLDVKVAISQRWFEKRLKSVRPGEYISAHLNFSEHILKLLIKHGYRIIHIIRDPRDVLLSHIYYAKREKNHLFHKVYKNLSIKEAINVTLEGGFFNGLYMYSFASILEDVSGWIKYAGNGDRILIVKYEDLVGEKGGGSTEAQRRIIKEIIDFIGVNKNISSIDMFEFNNMVYGKSHTFRKGKIYAWKEEITSEDLYRIEKSIGKYIKLFGYDLYTC